MRMERWSIAITHYAASSIISRPARWTLVIIPDFGGSVPEDANLRDWQLNLGYDGPLQLNPTGKVYQDLLDTLKAADYQLGTNLFIANYDWRLPLAPSDAEVDGSLS